MSILDDTDLQGLADLFEDLGMKDSCVITHTVGVKDPYGTSTAGTVTTRTVNCLVTPLPRPVVLQAFNERIGAFAKWHVAFPLNTNPQEGDALLINGQKMIVQIVLTPQTFSVNDEVLAGAIT